MCANIMKICANIMCSLVELRMFCYNTIINEDILPVVQELVRSFSYVKVPVQCTITSNTSKSPLSIENPT